MNLEELDGRIGEGWGGLSPNGAHVNVVLARRGSADRRGRDLDVRPPVTRALTGPLLCRRLPAGVPADLAAHADDEQDHRDDPAHRDDDLGRRPARHRPGRPRLGRRRPDRGDGRPDRARRALDRRRAPTTRRPSATPRAWRCGKAIGMCVEGRDPASRRPARRRPRRTPQPVLRRRVAERAPPDPRRDGHQRLHARPLLARRARTPIVTGGNTGLGQAFALALAKGGANVFVPSLVDDDGCHRGSWSRPRASATSSCRPTSPRPARRRRVVDACVERLGSIDILVNSAGICPLGRGARVRPADSGTRRSRSTSPRRSR